MSWSNDYALVQAAVSGNRQALEEVVLRVQGDIYNLAIRFLGHPADAEDATQEILIKVITNLSRFAGQSALRTWVYRIATTTLLDTRERLAERRTFALMEAELRQPLDATPYDQPDRDVLAEEVKIGCTLGMLACLSREQRLAYILGEILGLDSVEASQITGVSGATFRKRLQLARQRLRAFMASYCGIADPANPCRCAGRINQGIAAGRLNPRQLTFADAATHLQAVEQLKSEADTAIDAAQIYRSHPTYRTPPALLEHISQLIDRSPLQRFLDAGGPAEPPTA